MGRGLAARHFSKDDTHTHGPQTPGQAPHVTQQQGSADQSHNETRPHTCHSGRHQQIDKQVLARLPRKGDPVPSRWDCTAVRPPRNTEHQKSELPYHLAVPPLGVHHEKRKTLFQNHRCTCVHCSTRYTSQMRATCVPRWANGEGGPARRPTQECCPKQVPLAIRSNVDGPRGHWAKWSKSGGEGQVPYGLFHTWTLQTKPEMAK